MRDRNHCSYQQFNIQLEKRISNGLQKFGSERNTFSQELSLEFRPGSLHREFKVRIPRSFNSLRCLCIVFWYLPEVQKFLVQLDLEKQTFSWLNFKQRLELKILTSSKDNMIKYLYLTDRYTGNELFGNILGTNFKVLSKELKFFKVSYPRPRKKIFRRGPKDKGSRRVISQGPHFEDDVRSDVFLKIEEEKFEKKMNLLHATVNYILKLLDEVVLAEK